MQTRKLALAFLMAALAGATGILSSGAAGGVPYVSKGITVTPDAPSPGGKATVTAKGFRPGSEVTVRIGYDKDSLYIELDKSHADADGVAEEHVVIPKSFVPGSSHTVKAEGVEVSGHSLSVSTTVTLSKH
jgi:hypothetical protein